MTDDQRPIAIVGGLGKTGRRVAGRLVRLGHPVRPLSRSTAPTFDWDVPSGWRAALSGARSAYVTFQPDLSVPHAPEAIARLAEVARERGLDQVVLLSGRGEEGAQRAERALAQSGLCWTVARASWFMQNFSESFLADGVHAGEVALPVKSVREPFVDADDIADVAVAVLTGRATPRRVYEVTGPAALTFAEATATISRAGQQAVRFRALSVAEFTRDLQVQGLPVPMIDMLVELFTVTLDGRNSHLADGVAQALGRVPASFADYAARTFAGAARSDVAA